MSKHTPGPWTVRDNDIYAGDEMISVAYGFIDGRGKVIRPPMTYANARLIAEAPALLGALEALLQNHKLVMMTRAGYSSEQVDEMIVQSEAREIIARIKGGPHE